jgi:hypothetical protein
LASITYPWQEFSTRPGKNNTYLNAVFCRKLLKESFLASITYPWQEFSTRPGKNNTVDGKEI